MKMVQKETLEQEEADKGKVVQEQEIVVGLVFLIIQIMGLILLIIFQSIQTVMINQWGLRLGIVPIIEDQLKRVSIWAAEALIGWI